MKADDTWIELFDKLQRGTLTAQERIDFENRLASDENFRRSAEAHGELITALKVYGKRKDIKAILDQAHDELIGESPEPQLKKSFWRERWPVIAVAASLTLFLVVSGLFLNNQKQSVVEYKELGKKVDRLQKSQKQMMAEIRENAKPEVPPGNYSGTGFFISATGFLATSYHVVKGADSVYVQNEKYGRRKVSVIFSDLKKDIAILELEDKTLLPRSLPYLVADLEANLGEGVYTLGFPRQDIVFGEGSISALSGYKQNPDAYQISVPVNPGNSGGPLFNDNGDLVGIISGLQTQTYGAAFATKSSVLHEVVAEFPADSLMKKIALPARNTLKHQSRVEQVKRWKDFVFMVSVYNKD